MNFQVTVLKILVSYPGGKASLEHIKRDMAILATSGRDWSDRTKRLAVKVPGLDIFTQGLIDRQDGCWIITEQGRSVLAFMEDRSATSPVSTSVGTVAAPTPAESLAPDAGRRKGERRGGRRA